jgi:hypothetical protein
MFAQLSNRESLRDLIVALDAHHSKCYHMEMGKNVSKSSLVRANQDRDYRIFEEFAYFLVNEAREKRATDIFKLNGNVYAFDSTTIDLSKYEGIIRLILREGGDDSIRTYEQFYSYIVEHHNLEKEEITFVQQKTGLEVCIPLRSVVGNAIYDYIVNERPKCTSDNIFISAVAPFTKLSPAGVSHDCERIFKEVDIHQEKGRGKGTHLFRHAFASGLIAQDTPFHVVSELLGHASLTSLNPYLDADIEHLRECALSISPFSETHSAYIEPFYSPVQEIIWKYIDQCIEQGIWCGDYHKTLRSFDNYCHTTYPDTSSISQEMLNLWCKPITGESRKVYLKRINAMRGFVSFLSVTHKPAIVMPEPENIDKWKKSSLKKEYTSTGAGLFNQFVSHPLLYNWLRNYSSIISCK